MATPVESHLKKEDRLEALWQEFLTKSYGSPSARDLLDIIFSGDYLMPLAWSQLKVCPQVSIGNLIAVIVHVSTNGRFDQRIAIEAWEGISHQDSQKVTAFHLLDIMRRAPKFRGVAWTRVQFLPNLPNRFEVIRRVMTDEFYLIEIRQGAALFLLFNEPNITRDDIAYMIENLPATKEKAEAKKLEMPWAVVDRIRQCPAP